MPTDPHPPRHQAPAHYRLKAGKFDVTVLCDGHLQLPPSLFPAASEAEAAHLAQAAFLAPGAIPTAINAFIVEADDQVILIDTGMGPSGGPGAGRLIAEMLTAGIDPSRVTSVLLTHLHGDHCGGLRDGAGEKLFPNAELLVAEPEKTFWSDAGLPSRMPEWTHPSIDLATSTLAAYQTRTTLFAPGTEALPGIKTVALPGHTPGHTGFILGDGDDALFIWGDIVHLAAFQFAHPEWGLVFDTDQAQAAATRLKTFDQAATDRMRIAGMHLAFPGIGHVTHDTAGYHFVPSPWLPID